MIRTIDGYEINKNRIKIKEESIKEKEIKEISLQDYAVIFYKKEIEKKEIKLSNKELLAYLFFNFNTVIKENTISIFSSVKNKKIEILKKELEKEIISYKEFNSDINNKIIFNIHTDFLNKIKQITEKDFLENLENSKNLIYLLLKYFSFEKDKNIIINFDKKILKMVQNILLHFKIKSTRTKEILNICDKTTILKLIYTFDINNDLIFRGLASYLEQKYLFTAKNEIFFYSKISFKQVD